MIKPIQSTFAAAALAVAITSVTAAESEPARYPWENPSADCTHTSASTTRSCLKSNWPSHVETIRRLAFLYQSNAFAPLERALSELTASEFRFENGKTSSSAVYWTFRFLMKGHELGDSGKQRLMRWREKYPESHFVTFVEARFHYASAFQARGTGTASSVSKDGWKLFEHRLRLSEKILLNSPKALKQTPLWHHLLLAVTLDLPGATHDPSKVFKQAIERWPRYFEFYDVYLTRLVPRWGGSWEKVEAFIDHYARELESEEGPSIYARLYINLGTAGNPPKSMGFDWQRMKKALADLVKRYPTQPYKNLYASYACVAEDKEAFADAMRQLPDVLIHRDYWVDGYSHAVCMQWAQT